jgi:hypothetical protein
MSTCVFNNVTCTAQQFSGKHRCRRITRHVSGHNDASAIGSAIPEHPGKAISSDESPRALAYARTTNAIETALEKRYTKPTSEELHQ